ncbi:MAG: T9SS type A sorting domain-containing protein [Fluviicola sp.]|nr:T9SS type A sorting domain-containing protein [Fluviicola sp.]
MKHVLTILFSSVLLFTSYSQWNQITSPYNGNLNTIEFIDQNIGYIGGNTAIMKTLDGGISWTSTSIADFSINCFSFPSSTTGYYGANNNIVRKTTNGGTTWALQNPNLSPYGVLAMSFPTVNDGYVVGQVGTLRKTTNGGTTWITVNTGITQDFNGVHFFDANVGLFIGDNGLIKRTSNGITSWSTVSSGTSNNLEDIFFIDNSTGFIVGEGGTILKTTNAGVNWTAQTSGTNQWLYAVCFKDALEGYAGGINGIMLHTVDGGTSWQAVSSSIPTTIQDIKYNGSFFIGTATQGRLISTYSATTSVDNLSSLEENDFVFFPNPTSKNVTLVFQELSNHNIKFYSSYGTLVKSIDVFEEKSIISVEDLPNGIYFIEATVKNSIIRKKIVIQ